MNPGMAIAKRAIDVGISVVGIILLAPVMIMIAILIKLDSPGPIFYLGERMGRNGKSFNMFKFRSMYAGSSPARNPDGSLRVDKNDPRVTHVGRLLRVGFDELPQLFNVLKGDMSLVGPRPDPPEAYSYYRKGDQIRLMVRPGITGLAQITGRTDIPWRERLTYDIEYVEHQSLWLDCKIAFRTLFEFFPPLRSRRLRGLVRSAELGIGRGEQVVIAFEEQVR